MLTGSLPDVGKRNNLSVFSNDARRKSLQVFWSEKAQRKSLFMRIFLSQASEILFSLGRQGLASQGVWPEIRIKGNASILIDIL